MKLSRQTQLLFLAAVTVVVAIAATGWLLRTSPHGIRRTAEATVETGRRLVGDDDTIPHRDVMDIVGSGQIAVHSI